MTTLVAALGAFAVALGLFGCAAPGRFRALFSNVSARARFAAAIVVRLAVGVLLWFAADELRFPLVMRAIAVIAVVAVIGILVMGRERLDRLVEWWLGLGDGWLRLSALFAATFGAFLVYVAV